MILDGSHIASVIREELSAEIATIVAEGGRPPSLAVIIAGHNPASETYVRNKIRACEQVGIQAQKIAFEADVTEETLLQQIDILNQDPSIDGFIVQLPLPEHISEQKVAERIDYRKDVDGLCPENIGRTMLGMSSVVSATPRGIRELLRRYDISTEGKRVVVIGRSNIVGKPMAMLLVQKNLLGNATVTLCHTKTPNLKDVCLEADIIIVAVGQPHTLTADMVKEGCVVVDVGINRIQDDSEKGYRLVGDADFEQLKEKCSFISPVPGGVGPMTIVSLLQNTLQAYKFRTSLE